MLLVRVPASGSAEATDVRVSSERFAVALETGERELTTLGGNAAPLVYWTTDGARHSVTNVLGRKARGATTTYTVATDEPNRRAAIGVAEGRRAPDQLLTGRPQGRRSTRLLDDSAARARFLGTGQRIDSVGLQRTVQPLKVFNSCTSSVSAYSTPRHTGRKRSRGGRGGGRIGTLEIKQRGTPLIPDDLRRRLRPALTGPTTAAATLVVARIGRDAQAFWCRAVEPGQGS